MDKNKLAMVAALTNPPTSLLRAVGELQAILLHKQCISMAETAIIEQKRKDTRQTLSETTLSLVVVAILSRMSAICMWGRSWSELYFGHFVLASKGLKGIQSPLLNQANAEFFKALELERIMQALNNNLDAATAQSLMQVSQALARLEETYKEKGFSLQSLKARIRLGLLDEIRKEEHEGFIAFTQYDDILTAITELTGSVMLTLGYRCILSALEYGEDLELAEKRLRERILELVPNQEAWYASQCEEILNSECDNAVNRISQQLSESNGRALIELLTGIEAEAVKLMLETENKLKELGFI